MLVTGDYVAVEAVARADKDHERQAEAMADLVEALASAGHHVRAETVASSITASNQRARALTALAEASQPATHRGWLIAWALAIGTWSEPLGTLARIDPTTALAAARACRRRLAHSPGQSSRQ